MLRARTGLVAVTLLALAAPAGYAALESAEPPAQPAKQAKASKPCARYAAVGAKGGNGSLRRPYGSVRRLARSLRPGQTGCLRRGTFLENVTLRRGGRVNRPITLRPYPGERATIQGRLVVSDRANWVTIRDLRLDGRDGKGLPSPTVNGDSVVFIRNEVTNRNTAICFLLGNPGSGRAVGTRIVANRIHHCGRLPASNQDHGIYVEAARDTLISRNWIHDNADRGIQLYPDAQQTVIIRNVIRGNGSGIIFSGTDGTASSDTLVENNVIAESVGRHNVESYYPPGNPIGQANVVRRNCVGGGVRDAGNGGIAEPIGFTAVENLLGRPAFVNSARGDLRLRRSSACRGVATAAVPGPRLGGRRAAPALRK